MRFYMYMYIALVSSVCSYQKCSGRKVCCVVVDTIEYVLTLCLLQEWDEKAKKARKRYDQVMVEYKATGKVPTASPSK